MSSTVGFLESARSGLNAAQLGLSVTRQNISNADTEGYTRQAIDQSAKAPDAGSYRYLTTSMKVGQGVNINTVYQIRNEFLDVRYRAAMSGYKMYDEMYNQLTQIEDQFNEFTDSTTKEKKLTGLSGMLDKIGNSIKNFTGTTSDPTFSNLVQSDVDYLASSINTDARFLNQMLDKGLQELGIYVNGGMGDTTNGNDVSGIDGIIETIQSLNSQIVSYEITGQKANELRDQRNLMLDNLATYIDIDTSESANGIVSIQLQSDRDAANDKYIISAENTVNEFDVKQKTDTTTGQSYTVLQWGKTIKADGSVPETPMYENQIADVEGGLVKAYLNVINGDGTGVSDPSTGRSGGVGLLYIKTKLNDFAKALADTINDNYKDHLGEGETYAPLVEYNAANPAETISISQTWRSVPETFVKGIPDDETSMSNYLNGLYDALYSHAGEKVDVSSLSGGASSKYNGTLSGFADSISIDMYSAINVLSGKATAQKTMSDNLDDQRHSISSVSVNDEGINLIKYQQAYNASARIITAIDEMLDKLINGTGTVGL